MWFFQWDYINTKEIFIKYECMCLCRYLCVSVCVYFKRLHNEFPSAFLAVVIKACVFAIYLAKCLP